MFLLSHCFNIFLEIGMQPCFHYLFGYVMSSMFFFLLPTSTSSSSQTKAAPGRFSWCALPVQPSLRLHGSFSALQRHASRLRCASPMRAGSSACLVHGHASAPPQPSGRHKSQAMIKIMDTIIQTMQYPQKWWQKYLNFYSLVLHVLNLNIYYKLNKRTE